MSKIQTVFSEICVAAAIADTSDIRVIKNITDKPEIQALYAEALKNRINTDPASVLALTKVGAAIREFLRCKGIIPKEVAWTGNINTGSVVTVAKDIEVSNYRISVKENANVFINASPLTVFEDMPLGKFGQKRRGSDWFLKSARDALNEYYLSCVDLLPVDSLIKIKYSGCIEDYYRNSNLSERKKFAAEVADLQKNPGQSYNNIRENYAILCQAVSKKSAELFNDRFCEFKNNNLSKNALNPMFHYFFRINGVEYILAGTEKKNPFAVLVLSGSDWIKEFRLLDIKALAKPAGQPEVVLRFLFKKLSDRTEFSIDLIVQIRWSHGKFCGNPEAKIYKSWAYNDLPWCMDILN